MGAYFLKKQARSPILEGFGRNIYALLSFSGQQYLKIPLRTLYMKLGNGTIPATKPGKRYVLYQDELDKWLECNRKNPVPLTVEEENAAVLASNRRKPSNRNW